MTARSPQCPVCARPVAHGAWQCPYCDEPLPGRVRALFVEALAFPLAPITTARALATDGAARQRAAPWLAAAIVASLLAVVDPAFRTDALRLWSAHGAGLAIAGAAVSALCHDGSATGVADTSARGRVFAALRRCLARCFGAAFVAAALFALLPAPWAAAALALITLARQMASPS